MIRFSLHCPGDHRFDGWFRSNADFDEQRARGLVACPVCGSAEIGKALMAPAVARGGTADPAPAEAAPAKAAQEPAARLALSPQHRQALAKLRALARAVKAHAEDVGPRFAEEARRIHYGEADERGIYGQATAEEARALSEEGIPVAPIPIFPEDAN